MIYVILTFNKNGEKAIEKLPIGDLSIKEASALQAETVKKYRNNGYDFPTIQFVNE